MSVGFMHRLVSDPDPPPAPPSRDPPSEERDSHEDLSAGGDDVYASAVEGRQYRSTWYLPLRYDELEAAPSAAAHPSRGNGGAFRLADLPRVPRLSHIVGPSAIMLGASLGSGETLFWPVLTAQFGWAVFWAFVVVAFARPVAGVFVGGEHLPLATTFVRAAAVSVVPLGVDGSVTGTLRGAGDTTVPFLATLAGLYLVALPVAWLGTVTALGVLALPLALVAETVVPMVVTVARFRTGAWKTVSRAYRPDAVETD
jgi:hypothetical protein